MALSVITIEDLIDSISAYYQNKSDLELVRRAYQFASFLHKDQKRKSGEPYIVHPLSVAHILTTFARADMNTICAALLHDTIEDTNCTEDDIIFNFGEEVANLVLGVTKIRGVVFSSKEEGSIENQGKILNGMESDIRIVLIKLADRLHNMRTLEYKTADRQKAIAQETLDFYVPIAYYLGTYRIKNELEDLCFKYIDPDKFLMMRNDLEEYIENTKDEALAIIAKIKHILDEKGISSRLTYRTKNIYGVYKRVRDGFKVSEIHDLWAIQVILKDIPSCYQVLGIIHSLYPPFNQMLKDLIARPKTTMYRSLHTSVFGENGRLIQFQIRTEEMDEVSLLGLPYYWDSPNVVMDEELHNKFQFFKSLVEANNHASSTKEFMEEARSDIFTNMIYVFTPMGEVVELPLGSTPIDYAYKIHSDVGNKMEMAIVNASVTGFDYKLKNNDIVKIITNESIDGPKEEYLGMCRTNLAKRKINEFFRKRDKEQERKDNLSE